MAHHRLISTCILFVAAACGDRSEALDGGDASIGAEPGADAGFRDAGAVPGGGTDTGFEPDLGATEDSGGEADQGAEDGGIPDRWAPVRRVLDDAVADGTLLGYAFTLHTDRPVPDFTAAGGDYALDQFIPMDSCSKPATGLTVLRVVQSSRLGLDDSMADVLGWTGPEGAVTVRQLLAFTSGFDGSSRCLNPPAALDADGNLVVRPERSTTAECAEQIRAEGLIDPPGTVFHYGGTHQQILAHVVETVTGSTWDAVFREELGAPLGLEDGLFYASNRVAGSAVGKAETVSRLFRQIGLESGLLTGGGTLLDPDLGAAFVQDQTADPVDRTDSPWQRIGKDVRFGLGIWIDCEEGGCVYLGSGANGSTAWIDPVSGHAAALLLYQRSFAGYQDGYDVFRRLLPVLREALRP